MLFFPGVIYEFVKLLLHVFLFHNHIIRLDDLIAKVVCDIQHDRSEVNKINCFRQNRVLFSYFETAR